MEGWSATHLVEPTAGRSLAVAGGRRRRVHPDYFSQTRGLTEKQEKGCPDYFFHRDILDCQSIIHYSMGMPVKLRPHVLTELMARFKRLRREGWGILEACADVGEKMGIPSDTVYRAQMRLAPSTDLAADIIKANAAKLAYRAVRKANVDQSIEMLSRTNIGVLAPAKEGGAGGNQFIIGVSVSALGAVQVGVKTGEKGVIDYAPNAQELPTPVEQVESSAEISDYYESTHNPTSRKSLAKPVEVLPPLATPMPHVARSKPTQEAHQRAIVRAQKKVKNKENRDRWALNRRLKEEMRAKRGNQ